MRVNDTKVQKECFIKILIIWWKLFSAAKPSSDDGYLFLCTDAIFKQSFYEITIIIFTVYESFFFSLVETGLFHWCLGDNKYYQISGTLSNIIADFNSVVRGIFFSSPSLCSKLLRTIPKMPSPIAIPITFIFFKVFSYLTRCRYLFILSLSFIFTLLSVRTGKFTRWKVLFFLLIRYGLPGRIRGYWHNGWLVGWLVGSYGN